MTKVALDKDPIQSRSRRSTVTLLFCPVQDVNGDYTIKIFYVYAETCSILPIRELEEKMDCNEC